MKHICWLGFAVLLAAATSPDLSAKGKQAQAPQPDMCVVPPGARYRGLENQLYRVEVHDGGPALDAGAAAAPVSVSSVAKASNCTWFE